jgi:hypothetical protein
MQSGSSKAYPMDQYDGGRAASEPEHFDGPEVDTTELDDDEIRAVALAIIALTTCSD